MARIRSIHPGLFTDEAFMAATAHARLLIIGLWTEADDQGVFEWKPLTLKARLLPVDMVDMPALLAEVEALGIVCRFSHAGKPYGAVRNFRKFQRPQKPTATHPLPEDMASYVGLSSSSTVEVEEVSSTPTVNPPQMEDVGDKREEKEEQNKAIALSSAKPDLAEAMVEIYHEVGAGIWPRVSKITAPRRSFARQRLKDCGGLDGWRNAMVRARDAPHLVGNNSRGWVAGFDFFMQAESFTKLLEGYYDARNGNSQRQHRAPSGHDNLLTAMDELLGAGHRRDERSADHAGVDDAYRDTAGIYRLTN